MHKVLLVASVVAVMVFAGCKKKSQEDLVEVPPPPPMPEASATYTPPADAAPAVGAPGGSYTVQRGDTLWSIAVRHYGSGQKMHDIARANGIADPNKIKAGQVLTLP